MDQRIKGRTANGKGQTARDIGVKSGFCKNEHCILK